MSGRSLTYVGHATVLVELDGTRVLTDPVLRGRVLHLRRTRPAPEIPADLDGVLVSHAHWDHLDLPSLERLCHNVRIVCPRGSAGLLRRKRFGHVIEVEVGERVRIGELTVTATFAEHEGGRGPFRTKAPALGYVIEGSARIYFAGDTALFAGMAELAPLDVALLPVAGWGGTLGPGHLDPRTAAEALRVLGARLAVPIHWGTYSPLFGRHRAGRAPADEFVKRAAELAPEVEIKVVEPGETLEL